MRFLLIAFLLPSLSAFARDGGISGGGGNLLVDYHVSKALDVELVEQHLAKAKPAVLALLRAKQAAFLDGKLGAAEAAAFAPLFNDDSSDISARLAPVRVAIAEHSPCFDREGRAFDGSSAGVRDPRVCMSAAQVARKTAAWDLAPQTHALLAHEFSESLGLTDEQAIEIQKIVLATLRASRR